MTDLGPPIASRWLSASIYLTIAVMCALGIAGLSSRAAQAAAAALCLAFALLYPLMFRRARSERGRAGYYAAQALVIAGLMLLRSRNGDVFTFLFFLMSIRVASSSPPRAAVAWISGFCLVSSGILLWANGRGALFALAFNAATFFFSGVFGFTLRQVAIANREKQRLLDDLRAAQRQLHELAVAEERNRLARDLHDSVKQQVFAIGMRLGAGAPTGRVGTYLIVGMLPWMAFADATQRGMTSLLDAGGLLHKNPLPPALFPARAVLASGVVFAPLLLALLPLYAGSHHFAPGVWALLPLLALQGLLCFLLAYLLAILAAALRDVVQVVGVALSLGVFLSPVLFPATLFPERWRWLLWLNPMTAPVLGYQSALLQGAWPPADVWLVLAAWIALLAGALSLAVARSRDQLVDWL